MSSAGANASSSTIPTVDESRVSSWNTPPMKDRDTSTATLPQSHAERGSCLTNARKHAPGAAVTLTVQAPDGELRVVVPAEPPLGRVLAPVRAQLNGQNAASSAQIARNPW